MSQDLTGKVATITGGAAAYQTSKLAIMGFGETLRHELADEGVGVSILFPGGMLTGHLQSSAAARPAEPDQIVRPEYAVRNLVADLDANEPCAHPS